MGYGCYLMDEQCRSRSPGTSMPYDQDLHHSLLDPLGFFVQEANVDPEQDIWMCTQE
jgi:hypothetical protein